MVTAPVPRPEALRYVASSADPSGGNPAGVVLDATGLTDDEMLAIAADVGFSETAFPLPRIDGLDARCSSPLAEVGGVVEDPATGAAAAALGGYLREGGHAPVPARLTVLPGADTGRPSTLSVHVPAGTGGIEVSGTAVPIPG
ncbi:PhzF family phenazine biosynthesis protein [Geodermatophilus sp. SYSU D01036]